MAVKVRLDKKKRRSDVDSPGLPLSDFLHPGERSARFQGLAIGLGAILFLLIVALSLPWRKYVLAAVVVWLGASAAYLLLGSRPKQKPSTSDDHCKARARLQPMADKLARAIGVPGLTIEVVAEGDSPRTDGLTVTLPYSLIQGLSDAEIWAIIAHEAGHIRAGHTTWRNFVNSAIQAPRYIRAAAYPLFFLADQLASWMAFSDLSADRAALLAVRDRRVLGQAFIKLAVQTSEDADISQEEIAEYTARPTGPQAPGGEVITHYRLGEFRRARPVLHNRVREIDDFFRSDNFKAACARMDEAYAKSARATAEAAKSQPDTGPT